MNASRILTHDSLRSVEHNTDPRYYCVIAQTNAHAAKALDAGCCSLLNAQASLHLRRRYKQIARPTVGKHRGTANKRKCPRRSATALSMQPTTTRFNPSCRAAARSHILHAVPALDRRSLRWICWRGRAMSMQPASGLRVA